jgi:hypothetical protein
MALVLPVGATEETALDVTEAITAEATENANEAVTEDMEESGSETNVTEDLESVLIILAGSSTKDEAVARIMGINPKATAEEALAVVEGFVEMAEYWDCRECVLYDLEEGLDYGLEAEWIEWYLDTYFADLPETCEYLAEETVDPGEVDKTPLSEIILSVAGELGITFEEAQELVANALVLGEKYFAESDFWALIVEDVQENPARWTLLAVAFLIILSLIGILIKRVLNDAVTNQKMKMALEGISKALFGDEDEDGIPIKATISEKNEQIKEMIAKMDEQTKTMIAEKNEQIETLNVENAEQQKQIASLEDKATQLAEAIKVLIETVGKVESNSDTSLKLSEETALQILQLLNIAMDRKVPITTAEARQIWYEHTQNRIKTIYEEGLGNGKNKDEQEV